MNQCEGYNKENNICKYNHKCAAMYNPSEPILIAVQNLEKSGKPWPKHWNIWLPSCLNED